MASPTETPPSRSHLRPAARWAAVLALVAGGASCAAGSPEPTAVDERVTALAGELAGAALAGTDFAPVFDAEGRPAVALVGDWRTRGYGYRLRFTPDHVSIACETASFSYPIELPWEPGGDGLYFAPGPEPDVLRITSHPGDPPILIERVSGDEPELRAPAADLPLDQFELFAETMAEHYAFFDLWGVDWPARVETHRPRAEAAASPEELYGVFESMLAGIGDGHLALEADLSTGPRRLTHNRGPTKLRIRALYEAQGSPGSLDDFFNDWFRSYRVGIAELLGEAGPREAFGGVLTWGLLSDGAGYIHARGMEGPGDRDLFGRLAEFELALDEILTALADAPAIVVDLTYNRGGSDAFARAFAARFADRARPAFSVDPVAPGDQGFESSVEPSERVRYLGPVAVLTSDLTISAGESLVLYLRTLPNVVHAGQPTRGALSNVLEKPLPNGFHLGLSNQRYVAADGECYEGRGIPPEVDLTVFDRDDPWRGHPEAVRAAAELVATGR